LRASLALCIFAIMCKYVQQILLVTEE